ncbi:hypothetical protein B0T16DRAFT_414825 [Cercophora newfieldiana]|uniref:Uncharacterized protein n=1 Tax=Cercophora newfieldiana TaxID=92897 RepID=A0AA39Y6Y7_9PEZI|nr:hypothetical protein B0T16DRAFT_414825 [Cercophora newfieldiana]
MLWLLPLALAPVMMFSLIFAPMIILILGVISVLVSQRGWFRRWVLICLSILVFLGAYVQSNTFRLLFVASNFVVVAFFIGVITGLIFSLICFLIRYTQLLIQNERIRTCAQAEKAVGRRVIQAGNESIQTMWSLYKRGIREGNVMVLCFLEF